MKKNIILSLLTALISIGFIFFILEVFSRIVWKNCAWWDPAIEECQKKEPLKYESTYQYPRNEYNFRDFNYKKEKSDNTVRIVCIGDSFTWGDGIRFDDTYPKRIERNLNCFLTPETGKKYEVLNISWCGYSTFQEVEQLKFIKEFHPDLIIWGYCFNDSEDWADPQGLMRLRYRYMFRRPPNKFFEIVFKRSSLLSFIAYRLDNMRIARGNIKYYKHIYKNHYSGWNRTKESFAAIGQQDVPVMFLIFPILSYDFQKYPFGEQHNKLHDELNKNKLPYIDFYDYFKWEKHIRLEAVPYINPHMSEIANRIVADVLYNKLTSDYKKILDK
jgi:hypothetical protein